MSIITNKEILHKLRDITLNEICPRLEDQGFVRSSDIPADFNSWGWNPSLQGYEYYYYRLRGVHLECVKLYVIRAEKCIRAYLQVINVVNIPDEPNKQDIKNYTINLDLLCKIWCRSKVDHLYPKYVAHGRSFWSGFYKIFFNLKRFRTRKGFEKRASQLQAIVVKFFADVNPAIKKWFEIHNPDILNLKDMSYEKTTDKE